MLQASAQVQTGSKVDAPLRAGADKKDDAVPPGDEWTYIYQVWRSIAPWSSSVLVT